MYLHFEINLHAMFRKDKILAQAALRTFSCVGQSSVNEKRQLNRKPPRRVLLKNTNTHNVMLNSHIQSYYYIYVNF